MSSELRVNTITSTTGVGTVTLGSGGVSFSGTPTFNDVTLSSINGNAISGNRNRIINGDMRIDQRNSGASVAINNSASYIVDRWSSNTTGGAGTGTATVQRVADAPVGFSSSLRYTVTNAKTPAAGDVFLIQQLIEGQNIIDFAYGTESPKTVTLSFWVKSSLTGTFSGSLQSLNSISTYRTYLFNYTVNSTNTWQYVTVTAPGDTVQVPTQNNTVGYQINFDLGTGSTFRTSTLNSWVTGNFVASSSALNLISTNGATFQLTGVQLEAGSVATPFERRSYGAELALCQRYYEKSFNVEVAPANGGTATSFVTEEGFSAAVSTNRLGSGTVVRFAVTKRASPTITKIGNSSGQWRWIAPAGTAHTYSANIEIANVGASGFVMQQQVSDGSLVFLQGHWTASIEL